MPRPESAESRPRADGGPLTVAQLLLPAAFGGHQRVAGALSHELVRLGHRVRMGVLSLPGGAGPSYADELRPLLGDSVELISVSHRGYLGERRAVSDWLTRVAPHVLHSHGYRTLLVDAPAAVRLGIATVATFHGFIGNSLRERLYEALEVRSARRLGRVIAVSNVVRDRLLSSGVPPERIALLPNALPADLTHLPRQEARKALGIPSRCVAFGWAGRLSREKGLDLALRAHAALRPPRPLLAVIGDGPERSGLGALARSLGTNDDLSWLGALPAAHLYLAAFDGLVLSSRSEGSPMVLLEAMHAGVPIVATRVGEVPSITGAEALLTDPERPEQLTAAMEALRTNPAGAAERAARARSRVINSFGARPWAERHIGVYLEARGGAPKRRA